MYCTKCQKDVAALNGVCPQCGVNLSHAPTLAIPNSTPNNISTGSIEVSETNYKAKGKTESNQSNQSRQSNQSNQSNLGYFLGIFSIIFGCYLLFAHLYYMEILPDMMFWIFYIEGSDFTSKFFYQSYLSLGIFGPVIGIVPALYGRDKFSNGRILSLIGLILNLILIIFSILLIFVAITVES
ncbi:hypothetical protein [Desulfovibrio litoralis]|uniref:Zinc-ribbon domain-containing protein n=1 Tax=Desulfovibrio litoralis DSM 11393 TaxID=1121455 RepID=A0A1M7TF09_9BACT|nr:hypothetical protein [Desulfovibrio litoralis]SHN69295.1 hypothetical protein SAMN02745728_01931 [Desulfovibrio litoralis DSM 11393]